jgi:hypothetical protein
MPIGVIVGLVAKSERWEGISLPRPANVALSFGAVGGNGVGLRGSIPVRSPR